MNPTRQQARRSPEIAVSSCITAIALRLRSIGGQYSFLTGRPQTVHPCTLQQLESSSKRVIWLLVNVKRLVTAASDPNVLCPLSPPTRLLTPGRMLNTLRHI